MKFILSIALFFSAVLHSNAQLIATVQLDEPVEGMCGEEIYALFDGFVGQDAPVCSLNKNQMIYLMNEEIPALKENPKFKAKGVMGVFINCEGQVIDSHSGLKNEDSELSKQICTFLETHGVWTVGKLDGKKVDCSELISYRIKKGKIYLD